MPGRTAWTPGNGTGFTWAPAVNGADLVSLANGSTVLSSVATIANQTSLDLWADLSLRMTVASATPPTGAFLSVNLCALLDDGLTYGDGSLTSGSTIARALPFAPVGVIPLANAALTLLAGFIQGILIPPGSFRFALYNNSGAALSATAANNVVMYRTYNLNLNN